MLKIKIGKPLIKTTAWNVGLHGAESWTILKIDKSKIEDFETWCLRRALKISWTNRVSNE